MENQEKQNKDRGEALISKGICPDCGIQLIHQGGCKYCTCGFEVCG